MKNSGFKLLYKGKDIERMNRDELLLCVKALFQKLKDKHHIILGLKMMTQHEPETSTERVHKKFWDTVKEMSSKK